MYVAIVSSCGLLAVWHRGELAGPKVVAWIRAALVIGVHVRDRSCVCLCPYTVASLAARCYLLRAWRVVCG